MAHGKYLLPCTGPMSSPLLLDTLISVEVFLNTFILNIKFYPNLTNTE